MNDPLTLVTRTHTDVLKNRFFVTFRVQERQGVVCAGILIPLDSPRCFTQNFRAYKI